MNMRCIICDNTITGIYKKDLWGNAICDRHNAPLCDACGRFTMPSDLSLSDGRHICSSCLSTTVCLPEHIRWVDKKTRAILASNGFDSLPSNVPIKIVSPEEMSVLTGKSCVDLHNRGLNTISTSGIYPFKKTTSSIYIFNMLPKLQFAGVLAHELIHLWVDIKNLKLSLNLEEGLCNLGSWLVYTSANTPLSKILIQNLYDNPDPVYGDGFRSILSLYHKKKSIKDLAAFINNK